MKIKLFSFVAGALALSLASSAYAAGGATKLNQSGKWLSYMENDGTVCGMRTQWPRHGRELYVKYYKGTIRLHLFKDTWRLDPLAKVKVQVRVDNEDPQEFEAGVASFPGSHHTAVNIAFAPEAITAFLQSFEEANNFVIRFPDGDEPDWIVNMEGSRAVSSMFKRCIAAKDNWDANATQPTGKKPTQPTAPTKPTKPIAKKKDDGSI